MKELHPSESGVGLHMDELTDPNFDRDFKVGQQKTAKSPGLLESILPSKPSKTDEEVEENMHLDR